MKIHKHNYRQKLLFAVLILSFTATITAQKISISVNNEPVEQVLKEITKQTGLDVAYSKQVVDVNRKISLDFSDTEVKNVLEKIVIGTPLAFEIKNGKIYLFRKGSSPDTVQQTEKYITGVITDQTGDVVIGASVKVKDSTRGTITDIDGKYSIQANSGEILVFSYIGYKPQEITIGANSTITVNLKEDTQSLDEVVIVGYGTQKKVNLTGAVSTVKMDDVLGNRPVASTTQALEGTIPGLQISQNNGKPGVVSNMNIRGVTSINNSDQGPLVLVDNVPMDMSMVDPNDIESISVLKDASSSAVYGARAAFGIILIKTKQAEKNTPIRVNYSNNFAFSKAATLPKKINPYSTVQVYNDLNLASYYGGQNTEAWLGFMDDYYNKGLYSEGYAMLSGIRYNLAKTDAYNDMLSNSGFQQQHNISLTGGGEKSSYRASFGMVDEDGILYSDRDSYKRYSMSVFLSMDATKWLTGQIDVRYSDSNTSTPQGSAEGSNFWYYAGNYQPMALLGNGVSVTGDELPYNSPRNLIMLDDPKINRGNVTRILGRAIVKPFEGMEVIGEYSFNRDWASESMPQLIYKSINSVSNATLTSRTVNNYYMNQWFSTTNAINIYGTYKKSFKDIHNITLMAGYNQESYYYESLYGKKEDLLDQSLPSLTLANGTPITTDSFKEYAVRGLFYRANYDYKGRYLFEASGRYDGSSRFNKDGRFGFFPSFAAGWRITEESFMESTRDILSNLKVRVTWGTIGNQNVDNLYGYLSTMTPMTQTSDTKSNWILPGQTNYVTSMGAPSMVSAKYTWETVETLDFGIDLGLFNNQLNATFDWYQRDTKDMLAPAAISPSALGVNYPNTNAADLRSKGWELSVQWNSKIGEKIRYNLGFNIYDSKATITRYDNPTGLLINTSNSQLYLREDMKYGEIWGYVTDRYYTAADFDSNGKLLPGIPYVRGYANPNPGDILFKDLGGGADGEPDGIIDNGTNRYDNPGDMRVIGNNTARYQFGLTGGVSWNNFDLSFFFNGVGKRDLVMPNYWAPNGTFVSSVFDYQADYWKQDGDNSYWPRIYGSKMTNVDDNNAANNRTQTKYLQNGSFIRLKNVTLGYTLPKHICNRLYVQTLKFFISGENLYTWDHLPTGYYPDMYVAKPGDLNMNGAIQGDSGSGNWSYPLMRKFSFGLNLIF
ncbi:MAG: TonB-dependent receptor [Tannerella sp.]|jgi:TonB-linked SusC/RagA family outer membrane protein|nr:TonB-dependent receptor [Tannerella sp.]